MFKMFNFNVGDPTPIKPKDIFDKIDELKNY